MIDFFKEIEYVSVKGQHHFEQIKNSLTIQLRGQNVERMLLNEVLEPWLIESFCIPPLFWQLSMHS